LPVGLGAERDPASGAPLSPQLGRKALIALAIAAFAWLVFYAAIALKFLDL
jgi:predicted secreted protein